MECLCTCLSMTCLLGCLLHFDCASLFEPGRAFSYGQKNFRWSFMDGCALLQVITKLLYLLCQGESFTKVRPAKRDY